MVWRHLSVALSPHHVSLAIFLGGGCSGSAFCRLLRVLGTLGTVVAENTALETRLVDSLLRYCGGSLLGLCGSVFRLCGSFLGRLFGVLLTLGVIVAGNTTLDTGGVDCVIFPCHVW